MTTFAHIGPVPFEEWLAPLLASGGGIIFGLRAAFHRSREGDDVREPTHGYRNST